jgi:hypothetical protein
MFSGIESAKLSSSFLVVRILFAKKFIPLKRSKRNTYKKKKKKRIKRNVVYMGKKEMIKVLKIVRGRWWRAKGLFIHNPLPMDNYL